MTFFAPLLVAALTAASPVPAASPPSAGPVSVVATAGKTEVTVGERFIVDLKATGPAGTTFAFPGGATTDTFDLRTPPPEREGGPATAAGPGTHRYEAVVFALGEATLPPIPVRYRLPDGTEGEASSLPVGLKVVSLLPKDPQEQKLADIRGPQAVGIGKAFWVALGTALVLAVFLATWLLRRRRRVQTPRAAPVPELPADVEALRALDELAGSGLASRGEYRSFYIRLTEAAKRYLERRLGAPVLEMTTAETLAFLRGHVHGGDLLPVVRDLAEAADRIKFAKGQGLTQEAERHLAAVRALVPALEAKIRPVPAPATEGKAA